MRKVSLSVEAVVMLPVKVKLDILIRADDDANFASVIKQFAKGKFQQNKADVEDVKVESAEFDGLLDADEDLAAQVGEYLESGPRIKVISSEVTDSR